MLGLGEVERERISAVWAFAAAPRKRKLAKAMKPDAVALGDGRLR
jgi:hypothetical protein